MTSLCRHVAKRSAASDKLLVRIFGYLTKYPNQGVLWRAREEVEEQELRIVAYADADFAEDVETPRSTSGWVMAVATEDLESFCLLDWNSRRQTAVARSTCEAEITAIDDAMLRSVLPGIELIGLFFHRGPDTYEDETPLRMFTDSESARTAVLGRGRAHGMGHLRKHQRVYLHFLRDCFVPPNRELLRAATDINIADPFTKMLKDVHVFMQHMRQMGVVDVHDYLRHAVILAELMTRAPRTGMVRRGAAVALRLLRPVASVVTDRITEEGQQWLADRLLRLILLRGA